MVIDNLLKAVREAAVFNPEVQVAPPCILWPDRGRQWKAVILILQSEFLGIAKISKKSKTQNDFANDPMGDESVEKGKKDKILGQIKGQNDLLFDLINVIRANPGSDYQTLADKIAVSEATVKRHIQKLKRAGILQRKGSRKTGHWEVFEI